MMKSKKIIVLAFFGLLLWVPSSWAGFIINYGNIPQTDENVLFNQTGLISQGITVQGATNQTGIIVDFTGDEVLTTPSGGQARIEGLNTPFNSLEVKLHETGGTFTSLIVNIIAAEEGQVRFYFNGSAVATLYNLDGNGNNFFTLTATGGDLFQSIKFESEVSLSIDNIDDVRQVRIGGASIPTPEPASLILFGFSLIGLAAVGRRRIR